MKQISSLSVGHCYVDWSLYDNTRIRLGLFREVNLGSAHLRSDQKLLHAGVPSECTLLPLLLGKNMAPKLAQSDIFPQNRCHHMWNFYIKSDYLCYKNKGKIFIDVSVVNQFSLGMGNHKKIWQSNAGSSRAIFRDWAITSTMTEIIIMDIWK